MGGTGEKSVTRRSKFWARSSEKLELRFSNSPSSRFSRESRQARVRLLLLWLFAHDVAEEFGQRGIEGGACQLFDLL
jgi:hypothetical protein